MKKYNCSNQIRRFRIDCKSTLIERRPLNERSEALMHAPGKRTWRAGPLRRRVAALPARVSADRPDPAQRAAARDCRARCQSAARHSSHASPAPFPQGVRATKFHHRRMSSLKRRPADQDQACRGAAADVDRITSGADIEQGSRRQRFLRPHPPRPQGPARRARRRPSQAESGGRRPAALRSSPTSGENTSAGEVVPSARARQHAHAEAARLDQRQLRVVAEGGRAVALRIGERDP